MAIVYALLSVVSSYHDTLLSRRIPKSLSLPPHPFARNSTTSSSGAPSSSPESSTRPARVTPALPPASDHTRYTRYWTDRSPLYRRASRALATLNYLELLVEMVARRKGNDRIRWRVVVVIEAIKTCLRLLIMGITRRPVLHPPVPQREFDITALSLSPELLEETTTKGKASASENSGAKPAVSSVAPGAPLRSHLYPMASALPDSHLPHPLTLLPEMTTAGMTAEILTSTATLIHLLLLLRAQVRLHPYPLTCHKEKWPKLTCTAPLDQPAALDIADPLTARLAVPRPAVFPSRRTTSTASTRRVGPPGITLCRTR